MYISKVQREYVTKQELTYLKQIVAAAAAIAITAGNPELENGCYGSVVVSLLTSNAHFSLHNTTQAWILRSSTHRKQTISLFFKSIHSNITCKISPSSTMF